MISYILAFKLVVVLADYMLRFFLFLSFHLYKNEQLLEVTARAVHLVVQWGETGLAVADGLSNLLKAC